MKQQQISVILLILLLSYWQAPTCAAADSAASDISHWKLGLVGVATAAGFTVGHVVMNDLWWKGERVPFHTNWEQDWSYAIGADKVGHAMFPYAVTKTYAGLLRWSGVDSATAIWVGAGVAYSYQTYIEVRDGFSKDYGFSWGDVAANTIGAALPVVQHYVPDLRPFTLQVSFWPSQAYRDGAYGAIIDDYASTTHWLAVSVYEYLPPDMRQWYPPWLGIAVGHSVRDLNGLGGGDHVWYVSLDWDVRRIPGMPAWLRDLADILHTYHLPAPAVRIAPSVAWFGLRF